MPGPDVDSPEARNARTVRAYETYAPRYAESTAVDPGRPLSAHLQRLIDVVPAGGAVLEIGSGPGWEADLLEARGLHVRRTDVAESFLQLQRRRGKAAAKLDVIADELGGPYDAVMAMLVDLRKDTRKWDRECPQGKAQRDVLRHFTSLDATGPTHR